MGNRKLIGLLKYVKSEYAEDFEKGKVFFNKIRNYNILDEKYIGDKDEGKIIKKKNPDNHILIFNVEGSEEYHVISNLTSLKHSYTHSYYENVKIACFTCIFDDDIEITGKTKKGLEIYKFKKEFLKTLIEYESDRKIYICKDIENFVREIINNLDDSNHSFKSGVVNYYEENNTLYEKFQNGTIDEIDLINAAFEKDIKFENQKEFRILITNLTNHFIPIEEMSNYWCNIESLSDVNIAFASHQ